MPRARTRPIELLRPYEYNVLRELTLDGFGGTGSMRPRLDKAWRYQGIQIHYVTTIKVDGQIVAWALTFRYVNWRYHPTRYEWETYFFVHPDHRREGYGSQLYRHIHRRFGKVCTNGWDHKSRQFFTKMGCK